VYCEIYEEQVELYETCNYFSCRYCDDPGCDCDACDNCIHCVVHLKHNIGDDKDA
jgi:hypothetical protein